MCSAVAQRLAWLLFTAACPRACVCGYDVAWRCRDSDKIVVMDEGRVVEFDTPQRLLADPLSLFTDMVNKADNPPLLRQLAERGSQWGAKPQDTATSSVVTGTSVATAATASEEATASATAAAATDVHHDSTNLPSTSPVPPAAGAATDAATDAAATNDDNEQEANASA